MEAEIKDRPAFAHVVVTLGPGESITAEADAMATMAAELELETTLNGGFFSALGKRLFGREPMFINSFTNNTMQEKQVMFSQGIPGDIMSIELNGNSFCLQPGAYLCSTPGVELGLKWAGVKSWISREGLCKLEVSGHGTVWYGAYGGMVEKEVDGEYIVDTSHLVGYDPSLSFNVQLAGGFFSSLFGGEGLVTRLEGRGMAVIQTRSLSGLAGWLNPRLE